MAAPAEQRVAVPIDHPDADTEWNDILRKHQIIPERPASPTAMIEEALAEGRRIAHEKRLEGKEVDELDALEDDEDDEFLRAYRQKRVRELGALQKRSVHGSVYPVSRPEYAREVTEASAGGPVLVHLAASDGAHVESGVLARLWRQAALEYGDVKFCEIRAAQAVEGYPDKNCPTLLVYDKGDIVRQVVTLATLGGARMGMRELDNLLVAVGAVRDDDMRVVRRRREAEEAGGSSFTKGIRGTDRSKGSDDDNDDDDDDWD